MFLNRVEIVSVYTHMHMSLSNAQIQRCWRYADNDFFRLFKCRFGIIILNFVLCILICSRRKMTVLVTFINIDTVVIAYHTICMSLDLAMQNTYVIFIGIVHLKNENLREITYPQGHPKC